MYKCVSCKMTFDMRKHITDDGFPYYVCPHCGSDEYLRRKNCPVQIDPRNAVEDMMESIVLINRAINGTLLDNPADKLSDARYILIQFIEKMCEGDLEDKLNEISDRNDIEECLDMFDKEREMYVEP